MSDGTTAAPVIYSTGDAAKITGLSQQTIIRCFDAGDLKGFRVPGSKFRRVPRANLVVFMIAHRIPLEGLGPLSEAEAAMAKAADAPVVGPLKLTVADRFGADRIPA